jgi:hypothetical protein
VTLIPFSIPAELLDMAGSEHSAFLLERPLMRLVMLWEREKRDEVVLSLEGGE